MNNSQTNILVFLLKKKMLLILNTKGYKKFVDWCGYLYLLSYAYKFCVEYKTTNVLLVALVDRQE